MVHSEEEDGESANSEKVSLTTAEHIEVEMVSNQTLLSKKIEDMVSAASPQDHPASKPTPALAHQSLCG